MKVTDYIVRYLIEKGITDVFGYPGGMVTHLMDSFAKYNGEIDAHVTYHEQGAAFAACGYAQSSGKPGVAYATSGPGATNLITGICNAFYDSIPTVFITGQVNSFESKGNMPLRQRGFQEADIVSLVENVTKYSVYVDDAQKIKFFLDKAFFHALDGRRGPVLLDIPMNIQREEIEPDQLASFEGTARECETMRFESHLCELLMNAKRPCFLIGNGIKGGQLKREFQDLVKEFQIPVISSMLAFDVVPSDNTEIAGLYYGFIGAYGHRCANFIAAKSDLIITIGTRLDIRQVGVKRESFARNAQIVRIDIDEAEFSNPVHEDEVQYALTVHDAVSSLSNIVSGIPSYGDWLAACDEIRDRLRPYGMEDRKPNEYVRRISEKIPGNRIITTDVGQNQVWIAQSFLPKEGQEVLFSGGFGAMGYSMPAAIGAFHGSGKQIVSFNGDGGIQMNIQELQYIAREKLPIKIIVLHNSALGMIRHFQEMYFEKRYMQTIETGGYSAPDFTEIAKAYGIKASKVSNYEEIDNLDFDDNMPELIEIMLVEETHVFPKLEFGKPNQDQEPLIDRELYEYLMAL